MTKLQYKLDYLTPETVACICNGFYGMGIRKI